ncbi:hypothetical protein AMATHDRAFT_155894 [Amanita thiersii Skay4041]|uniref:Uncharacterized protein n=1 Tax=Amanita thiersii Skay4041 TaxID=703135 RepID=A0A2A9NES7_9AGAR|nr:hypothetical protein AMATHDRAFT_155894 [Amanita thiersii Skay4041]
MPSLRQLYLLLSTSWITNLISTQTSFDLTTTTCFDTAKTLNDYTYCHYTHVVDSSYTSESYIAAQPTPDQRKAWSTVVSSLLNTDGNCTAIAIPDTLKGVYHVVELTEPSGQSFCIFSEIYTDGGGNDDYKKGWGLLVVPSTRRAVSRLVHISAPFPQSAIGTVSQATAVFQGIGAKSLYIPGRNRKAFPVPTSCIPSTAKTTYYKTDSVHDNNEMFLDTSIQIINWQDANGGCPSDTCAYIQFMGKGKSACSGLEVFLSVGLEDNSSGWYTKHFNYPAQRIKNNLVRVFKNWRFGLPSNIQCSLVGTENIIGRLLNGVDASKVCTDAASAENTAGEFVQLEQGPNIRTAQYHDGMVKALSSSFSANCAEGMDSDLVTGLCVEQSRY